MPASVNRVKAGIARGRPASRVHTRLRDLAVESGRDHFGVSAAASPGTWKRYSNCSTRPPRWADACSRRPTAARSRRAFVQDAWPFDDSAVEGPSKAAARRTAAELASRVLPADQLRASRRGKAVGTRRVPPTTIGDVSIPWRNAQTGAEVAPSVISTRETLIDLALEKNLIAFTPARGNEAKDIARKIMQNPRTVTSSPSREPPSQLRIPRADPPLYHWGERRKRSRGERRAMLTSCRRRWGFQTR